LCTKPILRLLGPLSTRQHSIAAVDYARGVTEDCVCGRIDRAHAVRLCSQHPNLTDRRSCCRLHDRCHVIVRCIQVSCCLYVASRTHAHTCGIDYSGTTESTSRARSGAPLNRVPPPRQGTPARRLPRGPHRRCGGCEANRRRWLDRERHHGPAGNADRYSRSRDKAGPSTRRYLPPMKYASPSVPSKKMRTAISAHTSVRCAARNGIGVRRCTQATGTQRAHGTQRATRSRRPPWSSGRSSSVSRTSLMPTCTPARKVRTKRTRTCTRQRWAAACYAISSYAVLPVRTPAFHLLIRMTGVCGQLCRHACTE
jgi:hypothetical protein